MTKQRSAEIQRLRDLVRDFEVERWGRPVPTEPLDDQADELDRLRQRVLYLEQDRPDEPYEPGSGAGSGRGTPSEARNPYRSEIEDVGRAILYQQRRGKTGRGLEPVDPTAELLRHGDY